MCCICSYQYYNIYYLCNYEYILYYSQLCLFAIKSNYEDYLLFFILVLFLLTIFILVPFLIYCSCRQFLSSVFLPFFLIFCISCAIFSNVLFLLQRGICQLRSSIDGVQARCFHMSPLSAAAAKVAMSNLDKSSYMPYDKLQENLSVVKKRSVHCHIQCDNAYH